MKTVSSDQVDSVIEQILAEVADCVRQVSTESLTQAGALIEVFFPNLCGWRRAERSVHASFGDAAYAPGKNCLRGGRDNHTQHRGVRLVDPWFGFGADCLAVGNG